MTASFSAFAGEEAFLFSLVERYESEHVSGAPHGAGATLALAVDHCAGLEANAFRSLSGEPKTRSAYVCALVRAEQLAHGTWSSVSVLGTALTDLSIAHEQPLSDNRERMYLEGRVLSALPPGQGQDLKKALVNLTLAERMWPENGSVAFWLGRAHELNGNRNRAKQIFEKLTERSPPEPKRLLREAAASGLRTPEQAAMDGFGFGIAPGLFLTPSEGVGLRVAAFDDRLFDTHRSARAAVKVTTRGSVGVDGNFSDEMSFSETPVEVSGGWSRAKEDFFALGQTSAFSSRSTHFVNRWRGSIGVGRKLPLGAYFKVGWRAESQQIAGDSLGSFPAAQAPGAFSSSYSGGWAELGFDDRDSRADPHSGTLLRVHGFFPAKEMLSKVTFERWAFEAFYFAKLGYRHRLSGGLSMVHLNKEAPLGVYPRVAGDFFLPGVRAGRFLDKNLVASFLEYKANVWGPLTLAAFGTAATVAPRVGELFETSPRWGGGGALIFAQSRYRGRQARLEGGFFGGEFVFQAIAGADW